MIELYKFGEADNVCDPSPFCVKVETYLKMAGLEYVAHSGMKNLNEAPKGKLPYIIDAGKTIADSSFILCHLKEKYGDSLDNNLSNEQKAMAHGFIKMMDENLYWTVVHSRWIRDENWAIMKNMLFGSMPFPIKLFIPAMIRKNVRKAMKGHGIGRHSDAEITEIGGRDLLALSDFLGNKQYFFGESPSSLDATAFGILSQIILTDSYTAPIYDKARTHQNLVDFTNRIQDKYF